MANVALLPMDSLAYPARALPVPGVYVSILGSELVAFPAKGLLASVARLFSAVGPSAVIGAVSSIIVNPFDGCFRPRPSTHIGKERLEGVQPAIADRDP